VGRPSHGFVVRVLLVKGFAKTSPEHGRNVRGETTSMGVLVRRFPLAAGLMPLNLKNSFGQDAEC